MGRSTGETGDVEGSTDSSREGDFLLYDGECPVCSRYVLWTNIRARHPGIALLNAHQEPDLVAGLRAQGIEVNDTMVFHVDGQSHVGADAMVKINGYIDDNGFSARFLRRMTASRRLLAPVYPVLVSARKLLLRVLGRKQIS